MDIDRTYYKIVFEDLKNCSFKDGVTALTSKTKESFPNANLILGTSGFNAKGEYFDGESLVNYLKADLPEGFSFYGGMAGDDMTLAGSFVFTNDHDSNEAIMALVLNAEKVKLQGLAITGWEKLGIARTITKSEGNLVYAIDHQPAVEMYLTYLGRKDLVDDHNYHGMRDELGMYYPFIQDRTNGGTVLKTPMKIDHEKQALVLDLEMPAGTKFWFSVPPDFDIVDRILDKAKELKEKSIEKADALLIFTCLGRQNVLGPMVEAENEGLRDVWECPMAGFYTYGEYGPDLSKKPEFHSGACCWVTIKEVED